ncbi:putative L-asparaginase [Pandoraea morbifera]|uniref:Putative L-asparaginase n=1 Tax=Pandoraea morbifera TaxID=2508300 RepID=A0A5E4VPB5_9BURK|nr:asparaginase [Pandoraea morbifera]VVE14152.1 putative L-asparaginase [Pandoraea morbifera]
MSQSLPVVAVASLGGTISMTPSDAAGGVVPTLDAEQLARSVPGLSEVATIRTASLRQLPSASLRYDDLMETLAWAEAQVCDGAAGVVLTQGTDTLEETAFLLDLFWKLPAPLIVTGAMRAPQAAGADGPANLLAAVRTATHSDSAGRGVLVVMNDTVHYARWVSKGDSLAVQAFVSHDGGVAARVVEGRPTFFHAPPARPAPLARPVRAWPKVALVTAVLGDEGELAELAVKAGYEAVVIAAQGAGHVSFGFAGRIGELTAQVPVVIASRASAGATASQTYGYVGAEIDLVRRGAHMSGWLSALKSRLLVSALLASGVGAGEVGEALANWSKLTRQ